MGRKPNLGKIKPPPQIIFLFHLSTETGEESGKKIQCIFLKEKRKAARGGERNARPPTEKKQKNKTTTHVRVKVGHAHRGFWDNEERFAGRFGFFTTRRGD